MKKLFLFAIMSFSTFSIAQSNYVISTNNDATTGHHNTLIGSPAIPSAGNPQNWANWTTGVYNAAFGHRALRHNESGIYNTAIGAAASDHNITGSYNTALGRTALISNQFGNYNVAVGWHALARVLDSSNVALGTRAGEWLSNGNGNLFLGNGSGFAGSFSNRMYIHNSYNANPLIYGEFDNRQIVLNVNANVNSRATINGFGNHTSGLRFDDLTSASPVGNNPGTGVLTVDANGDVILVNDATGSAPANDAWKLTGNAGTTPGINFLGTTDDADMRFKRNSVNAGVIGIFNTALGTNALKSLTGTTNSVFGSGAMSANSINVAENNSVFGASALAAISLTAKNNTVMGAGAMSNVSTAQNNVAIGNSANASRNGNYNTAVGHLSGYTDAAVITATGNTFLGADSGYRCTGSGNVFLGRSAGKFPANTNMSNTLYVTNSDVGLPIIHGEFANNILRFNVDNFSGIVLTPPFSSYVEINGRPSESGLRFKDLTSAFVPTATNTKFLTVNAAGDVVLENIAQGDPNTGDVSIYTHDSHIDTTTPYSGTPGLRTVKMNNNNIFFDTNGDFEDKSEGTGRIYIGNEMQFPVLNLNGPNFSQYRLLVEGGILTEKVKVALRNPGTDWADYVFADDYQLMPLKEVEAFVKKNKHLPGVASSEELGRQGLDLGAMQAKQMEKIEELTLHLISQNKTIEKQSGEIEQLKAQVKLLLEKK